MVSRMLMVKMTYLRSVSGIKRVGKVTYVESPEMCQYEGSDRQSKRWSTEMGQTYRKNGKKKITSDQE